MGMEAPVKTSACRHGTFTYLQTDLFIGRSLDLYGEYSEQEVTLLCQLLSPGAVVIEAGANIGALTVPIARQAGPTGQVLAYEPQPVLAEVLRLNLKSNGLSNVMVRQGALGEHAGTLHLPRIDYRAANNFGGVALTTDEGFPIRVETVDALGLTRLDLIKIDVEGMELQVVRGASATVRSRRPILYVENDRSDQSPALINALKELGYCAWWHFPRLFNPTNFRQNPADVFHILSANLVCFPRERDVTIVGGTPVLGPEDSVRAARQRLGEALPPNS